MCLSLFVPDLYLLAVICAILFGENKMIEKKLKKFLKNQQFVTLGTASVKGSPHVSPKIFLKCEENYLYLIDYMAGTSLKNIRQNKRVSVSTFDVEKVQGFHIYGRVRVLDRGKEYESLLKFWNEKQTRLAASRVVASVRGKKNLGSMKLIFQKPVKIYKIRISRIVFAGTKGVLATERI